jgi:thiol-disulfide isomerase/thioredoxin
MRAWPVVVCIALATASAFAQEKAGTKVDAELRAAFDGWEAKWNAFVAAMKEAREHGQIQKGGDLPPLVAKAQQLADQERDAVLAAYGKRDDLGAASCLLLARLHEQNRDYRSAVQSYEQSLQREPAGTTNFATLSALCIAAMNSKDDALAARWMARTIAAEDQQQRGAERDLQVRTSWYPRTLIALEDWPALGKLLAALAADPAAECRIAATTFGVVAAIHRHDLAAAAAQLAAIRKDRAAFPDHQSWAVLAQLALLAHDGKFEDGAAMAAAFLAEQPAADRGSAMDQNWRRYLAAIAPFLGKPAPFLRVDHWVGGEVKGTDTLAALHGKVVVLDFWQPWCEPCRKAMPEMVAAATAHPGDLQVLGVCKVETFGYDVCSKQAVRPIAPADYPAHVAHFRQDMQLNYPLAVADTGDNSAAYAIAGVPTLVLIDRQGIVRYMSCGDGEPGLFQLALDGMLAAK